MNRLHRDLSATILAATGALYITWLTPPTPESPVSSASQAAEAHELTRDLLDSDSAAKAGAWWLESAAVGTQLSVDPELGSLTWRVQGADETVVLDARTGEALAFEFD